MPRPGPTAKERGKGAAGAALLTLALGYALVAGLGVSPALREQQVLTLFEPIPRPPPPERKAVPPPRPSQRPAGKASPPNLRAEPTEIVAPIPVIPPVVPPPVVAAPVAGVGARASAGSADVAGPGTGSGGSGDGRGGGGDGSGDGGGETPPRFLRGQLRDSDYPKGAAEAGAGGTVSVRYTVWTNGRVTDCEVTGSSGNAELDAATCRLIRERFRFRPSRDARGRPVPSIIVENHEWVIRPEPAGPSGAKQPRRRRGIL